jgi:hypothetical protein
MPLLKWLKGGETRKEEAKTPTDILEDDENARREEEGEVRRTDDEPANGDGTKMAYFACDIPDENLLTILRSATKDTQVSQCFLKCTNKKSLL